MGSGRAPGGCSAEFKGPDGHGLALFMRVLEYRVVSGLDRSLLFSMGAGLTAAGFATGCGSSGADYGAPCTPMSCPAPQAGSGGAMSDGGGTTAGGGEGGDGGRGGAEGG